MKPFPSFGTRLGLVALAAQLLLTTGIPPAFAQDGAPRRGEPITLNFSNAEIESVARTMAVITGRDVVVDPRVKGTINLQTDRAIAPAAAFNQFAAALRLQGFAVVQADGLYKVVPEADAKLQSSAVTTSIGAAANLSGNQIVTQVFKLNYEAANNLLPVLRPLIAPNNTINVNPGNNSLVITDYAENMRRLARIIAALDVPNASDIEVIPLKYSIATDMVPLVTRLVEGGSGTGAGAAAPGTADATFRTTLLADPRSNSLILRAANPARAQLVRTLVAKLDRAPEQGGNGEAGNIYVVYLKNADAVKLAVTLRAAMSSDARGGAGASTGGANAFASTGAGQQQQQPTNLSQNQQGLSGGLSSAASAPLNNANQPSTGGQIQADPTTNSLIITASEPQYRQLRAVIDRLDGRRAQVMVESLIIEVNANKAAEFGVQWQTAIGATGAVGNNSSLAGTNIFNLSSATSGTGAAQQPSSGFNIGLGTTIAGGNVLGLVARALQSNGEGNVLSTPNLLTLDNEEAKIVIGQNVPFVTGQYASTNGNSSTVNPFTTVERKDVGLTLRVKPQINENGTIKMQIFQEVSSVDAATRTDANGPTTNKRSFEQNVLVESGSIVMLGGLLQDDYSGGTEKVPLLGDIPLLGNLFKSEIRSRKKTNLMVFLRPVVMRDGQSASAFALDRYDAIRTMQQTLQPENNVVMRAVPESAILPPLPMVTDDGGDRRIEGTRLIPPPLAPASSQLGSSPLRGALPPTADPTSRRELP
ncbi:type II secretion system secretin GspD [Variovorax arabinosiphilus]|uniref:type II secretion system secretin GspD n=1 Tax=Variovorax arabinosiphilus TaxID=3053498 RepID=UPI002575961E|nr:MULTISPECIES: type II secretion system secretin GspD [unclassified Variovorax]MDM0122549.1 type II secretion system secretin GspD [Variovorax sp. J2L1-78]MDM0130922.1 type II secretion system secretin GspD [Variovorax sp. J2L1-63]MDM0235312.1 type II secretion system secretin GspD [Variovorax sp. J2R1-6]